MTETVKACEACGGRLVFVGAYGARYIVRCYGCEAHWGVTNAEANAIIADHCDDEEEEA